jgi:hypothetical protein
MVGFLVSNPDVVVACGWRPPGWSLIIPFRVGVVGLFLGFHQLHKRLPHNFAGRLMQVFETTSVKFLNFGGVSDHQLLSLLNWNWHWRIIV